MVIYDFNMVRADCLPNKTNPPLIINANAGKNGARHDLLSCFVLLVSELSDRQN
jgi:hypothetical protein